MIQKNIKSNKRLSHISNLEELRDEIRKVEAGLKEKEADLEERWNKLPSEMVKSSLGAAVPFFLNNVVASKTVGLVTNAGSLLFSGASKGNLKTMLLRSAKQLGLFAAIRGAYNLWKKK